MSIGRGSFTSPKWTSWAPPALPNASIAPSQHAKPPQISRNECALPTWQNNIAMNWLDGSIIDLSVSMFDWAKFRRTKGAIKLHL
jgi:hypothetical protein